MDLTNIVQNYKDNIIEIAKQIGSAKGNLKRKEYAALIDSSGLSKDQVSLSLKRFSLLQDQFDADLLTDYSDRMIKKITAKSVTVNAELMKARRKLLSLKRFSLLQDQFDADLLTDYSDRMIKKITAKSVTVNAELMKARRKLGRGEVSYEEFCILADTFKVIKTDDEKGISKAEALVKFVDKSNIGAEAMIRISEIVQPLANYTKEKEADA